MMLIPSAWEQHKLMLAHMRRANRMSELLYPMGADE